MMIKFVSDVLLKEEEEMLKALEGNHLKKDATVYSRFLLWRSNSLKYKTLHGYKKQNR